MSALLRRCVAVYSRHFVASRINIPAVVVAVFTLDHIVTTQTTMGWTKSLLYRGSAQRPDDVPDANGRKWKCAARQMSKQYCGIAAAVAEGVVVVYVSSCQLCCQSVSGAARRPTD